MKFRVWQIGSPWFFGRRDLCAARTTLREMDNSSDGGFLVSGYAHKNASTQGGECIKLIHFQTDNSIVACSILETIIRHVTYYQNIMCLDCSVFLVRTELGLGTPDPRPGMPTRARARSQRGNGAHRQQKGCRQQRGAGLLTLGS